MHRERGGQCGVTTNAIANHGMPPTEIAGTGGLPFVLVLNETDLTTSLGCKGETGIDIK